MVQLTALAYIMLIEDEDGAVGWLAGFAYQIPEIALKTSITYRSEIDHKASAREYGQSNVLAFVGSSPVYDVANRCKYYNSPIC